MKIGQLVQHVAPAILTHGAANDPGELQRLQDLDYCKRVFDLNFAFCLPADRIGSDLHHRYYVKRLRAAGKDWRVTAKAAQGAWSLEGQCHRQCPEPVCAKSVGAPGGRKFQRKRLAQDRQ